MNNLAILGQEGRSFWTVEEIAGAVGLSLPSARVFCSRKVKAGGLVRAKRNLYILPATFERFEEKDLFRLANLIQTPSYVSCLTALSYYDLTTQIPQDLVESCNPVRTKCCQVGSTTFRYYYCRPAYYFGFQKKDGFFIAEPEKALLDCLYLLSLGRYALDTSALDLKEVRWNLVAGWLKKYPPRTQEFVRNWRKIHERPRAA